MNGPLNRSLNASRPERVGKTGYTQGMHGGEYYRASECSGLGQGKIVDFSSNTNALALKLTRKLFTASSYPFEHYPDPSCARLRKAVAAHEDTGPDEIICGNGAAELIWLVYQTIRPSSALFLGPVFSEHIRACRAMDIECSIITPEASAGFACNDQALARLWDSRAELTVICTPNNPAGVTYDNMHNIFRAVRSPWVLVDLSYREFLYGTPDYAANNRVAYQDYLSPGTRLMTLHSFTKFFTCPGLRLGYLAADAKLIASLRNHQAAWSVNMHAQNLGQDFLAHIDDYRATLPRLAECRRQLGVDLRRSAMFDPDLVLEGPNFFCCGLNQDMARKLNANGEPPAQALQTALLRSGILIRNCDNIPGMPPGFVRIQSRGEADNQLLTDALQRLTR